MGYRLTEEAQLDLVSIFDFGADTWGETQAETYFYQLHAQFAKIAADPKRFPKVDHIKPGFRRSVFGSHSIYFKIEDGSAAIIGILRSQSITRLK